MGGRECMPWLPLRCVQSHTNPRFLASPSKCGCESMPDKPQKLLDKMPNFGHPDDVIIEL